MGRRREGFRSFISLTFEEPHAAAHPLFIFIEVDTDHFPLAKAGEVDSPDGSGRAIFPEIQHADLCFGGNVRGWNEIGILYFTLQDPVVGIVDLQVGQLRVDDDPLSGERKQRLQHIILQIGGRLFELAEEKGRRCIGVMDKGKCEFTDPVEPVGVSYPFDVEVLADINMPAQPFGRVVQFIKNYPVIDTAYRRLFSGRGMDVI